MTAPGQDQSASDKELEVSDCRVYKLLKSLGFERPCKTHCLTGCQYVPDLQSFRDARVCWIVDEQGNKARHVEIVDSCESMDKKVWGGFRMWQIRRKVVEKRFPDKGGLDISFDRYQEERRQKREQEREFLSRPELKVGLSYHLPLDAFIEMHQIACRHGFRLDVSVL